MPHQKEASRRHAGASSAWVIRSSNAQISSAASWVASNNTGGAKPARRASSQRAAQRHQRSPGESPAKPYSGRGVERSFPAALLKFRNAALTSAQTTCSPISSGPVLQQPSRKNPVSGATEQGNKGPPSTLRLPASAEAGFNQSKLPLMPRREWPLPSHLHPPHRHRWRNSLQTAPPNPAPCGHKRPCRPRFHAG